MVKWLNSTSVLKIKTNKPSKVKTKEKNKTKQNKNHLFLSHVNLNYS